MTSDETESAKKRRLSAEKHFNERAERDRRSDAVLAEEHARQAAAAAKTAKLRSQREAREAAESAAAAKAKPAPKPKKRLPVKRKAARPAS